MPIEQQESSEDVIKRIFGDTTDPWEAQDEPDTSTQEEQPETQATPQAEPQTQPVDNDQIRYNYWQSEAMKKEAELAAVKAENERIKAAAQQQAEPEQEEFVFPDPPKKPQVPYGYSPEEAMNNPQSESAKFVAQYQQWQEDIQEYNTLKLEYIQESFQEKIARMEQEKQQEQQARQQRAQWDGYVNTVRENVMKEFNVDQKSADEFIAFASSPESLTIENMFKMYQASKGVPQKAPAAQPTPSFSQSMAAANFPPPPGALPQGQGSQARKEEDTIMESMLRLETKNNDW